MLHTMPKLKKSYVIDNKAVTAEKLRTLWNPRNGKFVWRKYYLGRYADKLTECKRDCSGATPELLKLDIERKRHAFDSTGRLSLLSQKSMPQTFSDLAALYFEAERKKVAAGKILAATYQNKVAIFGNHLEKPLGKMRHDYIKTIHLQCLVDQMDEKALEGGPNRSPQLLMVIKEIFDYGIRTDFSASNPAASVKCNPRKKNKKPVFFSPDEIQHLFGVLDKLEPTYPNLLFSVLVKTQILTGVRAGELRGISWDKIDWLHREIIIDRQLHAYKNELAPPKTKTSTRRVKITDSLFSILKHWKQEHDRRFKSTPGSFVFLEPNGEHITAKSYDKMIKTFNGSQPIKSFTSHALRHTFCSSCRINGIDVAVTSKLMGHANITTTLNIYTHIDESYALQIADNIVPFPVPSPDALATKNLKNVGASSFR